MLGSQTVPVNIKGLFPFLLQKKTPQLYKILVVTNMKVKIFDESHEKDLEKSINEFLRNNDIEVIDIKYQVGISIFSEEQIYCFSALIIYTE